MADDEESWNPFPIEADNVRAFALSLGDTNPVYWDERYAKLTEVGRVIAPPTYIEARGRFNAEHYDEGMRLASQENPTSSFLAEQHFEYHQPIHPGDVLSIERKTLPSWEKTGRRGGRLLFDESIFEYRDQEGRLKVTVRHVHVSCEVLIRDEP